jgi:hypothetical protein
VVFCSSRARISANALKRLVSEPQDGPSDARFGAKKSNIFTDTSDTCVQSTANIATPAMTASMGVDRRILALVVAGGACHDDIAVGV